MSGDAKPVQTWTRFMAEATAAYWWRLAREHRRDGCSECAAGGCLTAALTPTDPSEDRR